MRLFVDARFFQLSVSPHTGIGRHSLGVLRHARRFLPMVYEMIGLVDPGGSVAKEFEPLFDRLQEGFAPPSPRDGPALFFQPSPMHNNAGALSCFLTASHILSYELFYDLVPLQSDNYFARAADQKTYLISLEWLKHYRLHAPISRYSADLLHQTLAVSRERMQISGCSLLRHYENFDATRVIAHPSICRFAINDYFIMLGYQDPRKNTANVMAAHARLNRQSYKAGLVIVGAYPDHVIEQLRSHHEANGGRKEHVQFLPRIDDDTLVALYHRSRATLCPSKNEGFSMPVIEAIACGSPVFASDCAAQLELVGQPEALFAAEDIDGITECMIRAIKDPELLERLRNDQASVPRRYFEEDVAARVWLHLRNILPMFLEDHQGNRPHGTTVSPVVQARRFLIAT